MRKHILTALLLGSVVLAAAPANAALVISKGQTSNVDCEGGICNATAADAVLNAKDLANMLSAGDVSVASGNLAQDIDVDASLSWASAQRLTLDAYRGIAFNQPVLVTGTGAVTIKTNDGGSNGDFVFFKAGQLKFWDVSSSLIINGHSYRLASDIASLAAGIAASPSGFFALANDYDASAEGAYSAPPVTTTFTGTFEGLGHAIRKIKITGTTTGGGSFRTSAALFAISVLSM